MLTPPRPESEPLPLHNGQVADKKLLYRLNKRRWPTWKQLKQLPRILTIKERRLVRGGYIGLIVGIVSISIIYYWQHTATVAAYGGEYNEGVIGAPQYVNPLLAQTNDVDSDISRLIFSGLFRYDNQLHVVPDLADHWQISDDGKIYTISIKSGATWHDDQPLTANDVVFTIKSAQDPDFKSPLINSLRGVEVVATNSTTVVITLPDKPYGNFLEVLTLGLLPEHIWSDIPPINANLAEYNLKQPVGSGPWKIKTLTKDKFGVVKSYTLVPYSGYYGSKPYLEKITFKFFPDFDSATTAFKSHTIDGISFLSQENRQAIAGQNWLTNHVFNLPQYTAVFFNQKQNEALKESGVRAALNAAIDRQSILEKILKSQGQLIASPLAVSGLSAPDSPDPAGMFNNEAAQTLLDRAGWQRITPEAYLAFIAPKPSATSTATSTVTTEQLTDQAPTQKEYRKKGSTILAITLTSVNYPEHVATAKLIQQFWEDIGVKVTLEIIDANRISREIIKPRNYQALLAGIIVGTNPDPYPFWHSSQVKDPGLNLALFANRQVDKLLEDARAATDTTKRLEAYHAIEAIITSELPALFLYNPTYTYSTDQKIHGIIADQVMIPADRFNNLSDWYLKTKTIYKP